jgi:phospholipase/carboxylesterase
VVSDLVHRKRAARGAAAGAIVLFHGRGADEYDLEPLGDALDPDGIYDVLLPRGPLSLPPGGAHWYVVPRVGYPDPPTFEASYAAASRFIDAAAAAYPRVLIGGFSQGSVMSLALGLGAGRPNPAGILALSGFIPEVPGFSVDLDGRAELPVFIAHGTLDPVIGVEFGRAARDRVQGGVDLTYRETPVGHTIDPTLLPEMRRWLAAAMA